MSVVLEEDHHKRLSAMLAEVLFVWSVFLEQSFYERVNSDVSKL